ncbi:dihydrolipoamide acetyltransferase family protein [Paenibacillus cymbidii]|uniref:dihydrolipoamide acetyltransferase family protein n=1 Tax=Paenibacillus cymbidii TaxID=1639034 RepID=UPI00107FF4A9|nr:dihydrolipoamide acetyltransferase family protein [Paenibacillus cymbidii]
MATFTYPFPELGEGIHEGEIVKINIKPGDTINEDDTIMEVQNDKAVVDVPCPVTGKVLEVKVKEGQVCTVGETVAIIEVAGELPAAAQQASAHAAAPAQPAPAAAASAPGPASAAPAPAAAAAQAEAPAGDARSVLATPSVRKLARERGVALASVPATGRGGRVTREDVLAAAEGGAPAAAAAPAETAQAAATTAQAAATTAPAAAAPATGDRAEERVPFKGIRKAIAAAMVKSMYTAPHVTLMDEVDVTRLVALREKAKPLAEQKGVKLTYLPFVVKALVAAARSFPIVNAALDEERGEVVYKKYYDIGIATDTENGLIVPVVKDADRRNIWSIASAIKDLAARGRDGKLTAQEMRGSTISITNIGSAGGMFFTPVINFPEAAILGTGRITEKPIVRGGEIVIAPVMALSFSFDHRLIDGATAQQCLNMVKQLLSDPDLLVMEV